MARSSSIFGATPSRDIAQIGRLLQDLEGHMTHLTKSLGLDGRGGRNSVPNMIAEAWSYVSDRFHDVQQSARGVSAEAARVGTGAWRKIEDEVTNHPLTALAIAAGIGFLIGALNRR
jgi:ElaB/YqjD/DUF883 family membrane-anchored ribosome-binding protein